MFKISKFSKIILLLLVLSLLAGCTNSEDASAPVEDELVENDEPAENQETSNSSEEWDMETEFLVIGGGVAGLTAAIEASDVGFEDIIVLEKLGVVGGSAFVSDGILGGYETIVTKELDLHIDPQDMYNDQMKEKKYNLDPDLTWLTTEKSGETIDWLIEHIGVEFEPEVIVKDGYGSIQAMHIVDGGGAAMRIPYDNALNERPEIEILKDTEGTELIVENDVVIGVIAKQDDKIIRIKADAIMLATGGYNSNHELIANAHPANRVFQPATMAWSTGDGLIMATEVGAGVNNLDQIQCYLREHDNPRSQAPYLYSIFVGKEGKRFMDEKRTGQTYNQENRDAVIMQTGKDGTDHFWSISDQATMNEFGIGETESERDEVFVADTLEDLALKIGIDPVGLKETVDHWNEMVENGEDTDYGRTRSLKKIEEAPYYGLKTIFFSSVCHGGITKNAKAEVTKINGENIPGLYAAGELTTVTNSNGYTISNAITFGRIAAQSAYEYTQSK